MKGDPIMAESLQDVVDKNPDLVEYFRNDTAAPHFLRADVQQTAKLIPPAFTNWRDEQYASFESVALLHQSHHMPELFIEGPDAHALISATAVNSVENFTLDRAKHIIAVTPQGHIVGDCIGYRLAESKFELVSGAPILNWIEFQAKHGGYDVEVTRDEASNRNPTGRRTRYRFELAGPNAGRLFDRLVDGETPDIPFFRTARVRINGHEVLVLRHGMMGEIGVELSGPYEEEEAVRSHIMKVGEEFDLKPVGVTAYFTGNVSVGWFNYPVPGIFTDPDLRAYREFLPATTWEASHELGGSYVPSTIEGYYLTPYDLGYQHIIKFDHDFIGGEALQAMPAEQKRKKVTFVWNRDDVQRVMGSQFGDGPRHKAIELPIVGYSWNHYDEVRTADDDAAGFSAYSAYLGPLGDILSLGVVDPAHAMPGTELVLTWGEPNGGTRKRQIERHEPTHIRVRVAPAPYVQNAQRATQSSRKRALV